jgi:hypothetical protein
MSGFMGSMASLSAGLLGNNPSYGLPELPGNLGLPESVKVGQGIQQGKNPQVEYGDAKATQILNEQWTKAETYNKAFADLLNNQPQLSGSDRTQIYEAYSNKAMNPLAEKYMKPLTNYGANLSQAGAMTPEQFQASRQPAQPAQQVAAPIATPMAAAPAPATVGPVPTPQEQAPAATPSVPSAAGNIAGTTTTLSGSATEAGKGRGKRGRMATLLTGLGGSVETFG